MALETMILDKKEGIALLTMNRPERMNAFNEQMKDEFVQALRDIEKDDEVRILVVTGAGKAFCAGVDVARMEGEERRIRGVEEIQQGFKNI